MQAASWLCRCPILPTCFMVATWATPLSGSFLTSRSKPSLPRACALFVLYRDFLPTALRRRSIPPFLINQHTTTNRTGHGQALAWVMGSFDSVMLGLIYG